MTRFLCRGSFMSRLSWCVCKWQTWPAGPDQLKPLGTALLRHESQMQLSAQPEGTDRCASKTCGTVPCSVRDRRPPPAPRCTHRQCAPGLRPSAQPGSEAPAAQVCAVNGLGGTFLPPWEHRAHQGRRVPWAAAPPLGRDTLCGRESSHGNWTQGPARSAATLAVSYKPSSVSHPGVSCLLPAPATPAGRPARSPAGRGDPRATPAPLCCPGLQDGYCLCPMPQAPPEGTRGLTKGTEAPGQVSKGPVSAVCPLLCTPRPHTETSRERLGAAWPLRVELHGRCGSPRAWACYLASCQHGGPDGFKPHPRATSPHV